MESNFGCSSSTPRRRVRRRDLRWERRWGRGLLLEHAEATRRAPRPPRPSARRGRAALRASAARPARSVTSGGSGGGVAVCSSSTPRRRASAETSSAFGTAWSSCSSSVCSATARSVTSGGSGGGVAVCSSSTPRRRASAFSFRVCLSCCFRFCFLFGTSHPPRERAPRSAGGEVSDFATKDGASVSPFCGGSAGENGGSGYASFTY